MIETSYRGFKIRFDEADETWSCADLEIPANPSLQAVKRRIATLSKAARDLGSLRVLRAERNYRSDAAEIATVWVTVLCEPEEGKSWRNESEDVQIRHCWAKLAGRDKVKLPISDLIPTEHEADIRAWMRLDAEAHRATQAAEQALRAIPRYDADSLMLAAKEAKAVPAAD